MLTVILLGSATSGAREPSEFEQYMLELINRARADPGAEVNRLSGAGWEGTPDLNEGPPFIPLVDEPFQPLAFNLDLVDAASNYADLLLSTGGSGHFVGVGTPQSRAEDEGYSLLPAPGGIQEVIAQSVRPALGILTSDVEEHWETWFVNAGVSGRIDRVKVLGAEYREIGIGIRNQYVGPAEADDPYGLTTVGDIAYNSGDPFITGVLFDDVTGDDFYTPNAGEALGGVVVDVYNSVTKLFETSFTSFGSGGYSVQLASGTYDFVIHDPTLGDQFLLNLELGAGNLKVDYNQALAVPEPGAFALLGLGLGTLLLRRRRGLS